MFFEISFFNEIQVMVCLPIRKDFFTLLVSLTELHGDT